MNTEQAPTTILLADDHQLVLECIHNLLLGDGFNVVATANDGDYAVELARMHKPRLALLDIHMPGRNGMDAGRILKNEVPGIGVLILTMHNSPALVAQVKGAGLDGFLVKNAFAHELLEALRHVAKGGTWFPAITQNNEVNEQDPAFSLTLRERDILRCIAKGFSSAEIADRLYISLRTVETHRKNINHKLGTHMISDMVHVAQRLGLI